MPIKINYAGIKKRLPVIIIVGITLALLCAVVWRLDRSPRTDDAYVYADTVNVVPEVSGRIIKLQVHDNQIVKRGDILFLVDPSSYQDALDQAQARLAALEKQIVLTQRNVDAQQYNAAAAKAAIARAQATAKQANDTYARMKPLLSQGYVSAEEVDKAFTAKKTADSELRTTQLQALQAAAAVSGVDALVAQRDVILAEISTAKLNLEHATVRAPINGRVVALKTAVGQYVSTQQAIFTLINTDRWYVIANFRESDLHDVTPGTPSIVYVMGNTSQSFRGSVDSIGYGVFPDDGGQVLDGLPRVNRSINWVHVSQRFPVKILIKDPNPELFRVGASAVALLHKNDD